MSTKSATAKLAKLAVLIVLYGLALALGDCASTGQGDNAAPPVHYGYGCCVW
jgi:hypothetical protein